MADDRAGGGRCGSEDVGVNVVIAVVMYVVVMVVNVVMVVVNVVVMVSGVGGGETVVDGGGCGGC